MRTRIIPAILVVFYCAILIKVLVLKDLPLIRIGQLMLSFGGTHEGPPNFIPFKTILPYLFGSKGWLIAGINLIGNIILLVPFGFLLPLIIRNMGWKQALLWAFGSGTVIELMQVFMHVGIFDIDDIILNALGSMIGFWSLHLFTRLMKSPVWRNFTIGILVIILCGAVICLSVLMNTRKEEKGEKGVDPCRGSGGTGAIVAIAEHVITIERNDSKQEVIRIIDKTMIRSSDGAIAETALKIGDRVTVVVGLLKEDSQAASLILVCTSKE